MLTVDRLRTIFSVSSDAELAELFGRSAGAVSQWRKNGLPAAIERAARAMMEEKGLVAETFVEYKKPAVTDPILQMINDRYDALDEEGREAMAAKLLEEMKRCRTTKP